MDLAGLHSKATIWRIGVYLYKMPSLNANIHMNMFPSNSFQHVETIYANCDVIKLINITFCYFSLLFPHLSAPWMKTIFNLTLVCILMIHLIHYSSPLEWSRFSCKKELLCLSRLVFWQADNYVHYNSSVVIPSTSPSTSDCPPSPRPCRHSLPLVRLPYYCASVIVHLDPAAVM